MAILKKNRKTRFEYRPRTAEELTTHKAKSGGREGFINPDVKVWSPKDGDNTIRLLPPTWDNADGLTYRVFAHYGIGPDNAAFLCLNQMKDEECPVCEARMKADRRGDDEVVKDLRPVQRGACWVIVRGEEKKGPQLYLMPKKMDTEIHLRMTDKKTGEVVPVDSPEDGYDLTFTREKAKGQQFPDYTGIGFERRSSPLSDDEDEITEWMEFVKDNPVPEQLVFADADHITETFGGEITRSRKEKEKARAAKDDDDDKPRRSKREREEPEVPTWKEVHAMDEEELEELAKTFDIRVKGKSFDDEEELADFLCEELEITPPKKSKRVADEDEEEDDERPAKKKKRAADEDEEEKEDERPAKKKRRTDDDDEDEAPSWKSRLSKFRK